MDVELLTKLQSYSTLVLSLAGFKNAPPDFNLTHIEQTLLAALSKSGIPVVAVVFGTPYSLSSLPLFEAIVVAFENEVEAQEAAARVLFGDLIPKGRLPISAPPHFQAGACSL